MKLLIDADFTVYKNCAACESEVDFGDDVILVTSNFNEAYNAVCREISRVQTHFGSFSDVILFFSDSINFRKKIAPDYKGHRNRKKPCGYKRVINKLKENFEVIIMPTLEADDALGIYATAHTGNCIVSPDKDMRQIPGQLYDLKEITFIKADEGYQWHLIQTLAGDQTDGYSGLPGYGVKRAAALFKEKGFTWKTIKDAFAEKDLDEDVALMNARLAKILTVNEYDFDKQQPILWCPTVSDTGDDSGTGSEAKTDS